MQVAHGSVEETLQTITQAALTMVPGAAQAGITLVIGRHKVQSRAATSPVSRELDELQERLGEGPCLQATWEHETVSAPDLATESRWPRFAAGAVGMGVGSMLSFQLYTDDNDLGAMNLYGSRPHAFDADSYRTAAVLATHAAIALTGAQQQQQWQSALATRDVIGQAKGMLMERYKIDAVAAFDLLTTLSQEANVKVAEIARRLVDIAALPPPC
ncbi:GAF and ANTAR domain-containing protein [Antrihabitans cavernicola]|uniref:GAF and ANTAR domain-containing protein n=2 Tax=Antrihabitans cavernicola TaxID=2495913 RepID=A0A5A7S204_9NOCA|nr:GAF and ANTAR domain-containing protein [Spelaeibacter cavernicola]